MIPGIKMRALISWLELSVIVGVQNLIHVDPSVAAGVRTAWSMLKYFIVVVLTKVHQRHLERIGNRMKFIVEDILCVLGDAHHFPQGNIQRAAQDQTALAPSCCRTIKRIFEIGPFLELSKVLLYRSSFEPAGSGREIRSKLPPHEFSTRKGWCWYF